MSTLKATTLEANTLLHSDGTSTTEPSIPALDKRMAKVFCRFDMSTAVISQSYNVSSLTDQGIGTFQLNYTNNTPNAANIQLADGVAIVTWAGAETAILSGNASSCRVYHVENGTVIDSTRVSCVVFGN
jgi:hypothetical protein